MNDYEEVEGNVAEIVGQPKPTEHALAGIVTGEHVPLHVIRFARVKSKYIYIQQSSNYRVTRYSVPSL